MRFTIISLVAAFISTASACTPGDYECGAGAAADTIMLCNTNGVAVPLQTCPQGMTCQNIGANNAPTCA
ncbi:hypothetical protein BDV12DRAFT_197308 [Aspergillus spectabilis]